MSFALPKLYLARHGDTAWTDSRQHTGRTDLPLNERGEERARQIGERLQRFSRMSQTLITHFRHRQATNALNSKIPPLTHQDRA